MRIVKYVMIAIGILWCANISYSYTTYHTTKLYGILGSGTIWLTGGLGTSYTAEITAKPEDKYFHAVTVDVQLLGIMQPSAFEFNLLGTYGLGYTMKKGHKIIIDVIGIGLNLRSGGYKTTGQSIAYIPPAGFVFNLPGFQFIQNNNFYFAWRSNFSVGNFLEFKSYLAIGYDFSSIYYD